STGFASSPHFVCGDVLIHRAAELILVDLSLVNAGDAPAEDVTVADVRLGRQAVADGVVPVSLGSIGQASSVTTSLQFGQAELSPDEAVQLRIRGSYTGIDGIRPFRLSCSTTVPPIGPDPDELSVDDRLASIQAIETWLESLRGVSPGDHN